MKAVYCRHRSVKAAAVSLFLILVLLLPAGIVSAEVRHTSISDVVIAGASGTDKPYFPDIVKAGNGDLLVVYYWSSSHVGGNGKIMMKRSTDDGATWSAAQTVADTVYDDRDPSIAVLGDGTLLLSWFTYNGGPVDVRVIRSTNNGTTWGSPVTVGTNMSWAATSSKIIELSSGDLLIPLYGPGTGNQKATVVRSTDQGLTWPSSSEKTMGFVSGSHLVEQAIAELDNGHIKGLIRASSSDNLAYEVHSYDYGATWGTPAKLDKKMHAPELFRIPGTDKVFQAWSEYQHPTGGRPVMVRIGYLGQPWDASQSRLLYSDKSTSDMGYSSTAMLGGDELFTVYYDAQKQIIGGTYSKLGNWEGDFGTKMDLSGMYQSSAITVTTDMLYTDPNNSATGPKGALDGSIVYGNAAFKNAAATSTSPSYYMIDLQQTYTIGAIGVLLKVGYAETANVQISADGTNWIIVQTYDNVNMNHVDYKYFDSGISVRYVKVTVTASSGWAGLNEIQLFELAP
ncbi:exo-alpha-sialidase [Paenibacillus mesophilus]|uniref:exo-alpha-sialidase n=1 Tax=Paenibacillus mesophilus TaxID=2582849 RepID=UPI001305128E|nr:exo-alpha-sialidase [Paenibacillus mesophilus]